MQNEDNWVEFDEGETIGTTGSEGGQISRDEENVFGARITLEEYGGIADFSITCGIYGWMLHTRFFKDELEAIDEFGKMKREISRILELISSKDEDDAQTTENILEEIANFVEEYP